MNIQEATKKALESYETKGNMIFIRREPWAKEIKIKPTNTPDCCLACFRNSPSRGWQPKAEDLMANDWILCD